jgi:cell division protein FtsB
MKDFIPLLQSALWAMIVVALLFYFRSALRVLRETAIRRIEKGASVKVGPVELGELRSEVQSVREEVNDLNQKVTQLFLTTMSPAMFENLSKLHSGDFGPFKKTAGLKRELYHLRDIGYVAVESISALPDEGGNLSDFVQITETGRAFVELRRSAASCGPTSGVGWGSSD